VSEGRTAPDALQRVGSGCTRLVRAWKVLPYESRLAAFASSALVLTLFLPWYQVTLIAPAKAAKLQSASATITGWGAFSFVEAAVLLVAAGVLTLLFHRAEGRAFHLPGGDGGVIAAAGLWTCVLIVWRIFDKQGAATNGPSATTSGVEWGIFIALGAAAFLAYAGSRIRAAHRPEPPLPGEADAPAGSNAAATTEVMAVGRPRRPVLAPAVAGEREPHRRSSSQAAAGNVRRRDPPPGGAGEARRRARPPQPVPADRRADPAEDPTLTRVVPPPVTPAGSATPGGTPPADADDPPADRRLATPLDGDDTLPLGGDDTLPLEGGETVPLGSDGPLPPGEDPTLPLGDDDTLPFDRRRRSR
jgi:hypothetical protein